MSKMLAVARGDRTKTKETLTNISIMSRETAHISLLATVLHDIDIWVDDVFATHIIMPSHEKILTTLGREFDHGCGQNPL